MLPITLKGEFHEKTKQNQYKTKNSIFILTLICIATLILSVTVKSFSTPFKTVAGVVIVPLQEGVNSIGGWFTDKSDLLKSVKSLKSENDMLKLRWMN